MNLLPNSSLAWMVNEAQRPTVAIDKPAPETSEVEAHTELGEISMGIGIPEIIS